MCPYTGSYKLGSLRGLALHYVQDQALPRGLTKVSTTPTHPHPFKELAVLPDPVRYACAWAEHLSSANTILYTPPPHTVVSSEGAVGDYMASSFFSIVNRITQTFGVSSYVRGGESGKDRPVKGKLLLETPLPVKTLI